MSDAELCFTPAVDLVRGYRERRFSPLEVVVAVLARIEDLNPGLNAFVTVTADAALEAASRATERLAGPHDLGPLHGVPVSIKDVVPTKGIRTTWGSKIFEHHVPDEDGLIVERLKAAGAIILGKTNTPEFAAGGHTFNAVFGPTRNPWNQALSPGGSSGGAAAAVAAGLGPLSQGSDLGGSLRTPAAFCGVVGFRGSPGLVPFYPTPLAWDTFSVQGPIARTVADIALMLSAVAGPDDRDPLSYDVDTGAFSQAVQEASVEGWRIAWTPDLDGMLPVDPEIAAVAREAAEVFRSLGANVETASPDFHGIEEIILGSRGVSMVALHADKLAKWKPEMQQGLVWNIEQGLALNARGNRAGPGAEDRSVSSRAPVHGGVRPAHTAGNGHAAVSHRPALSDRDRGCPARQLHGMFLHHLCDLADRAARHHGAVRLHRRRPAGGPPDRRAQAAGGRCIAGGRGLRGGDALARCPPEP